MDWEEIDSEHLRCKVPGGWLFKVWNVVPVVLYPGNEIHTQYGFVNQSVTFVPDPNHKWEVANI